MILRNWTHATNQFDETAPHIKSWTTEDHNLVASGRGFPTITMPTGAATYDMICLHHADCIDFSTSAAGDVV
jgi:hypothetical protein